MYSCPLFLSITWDCADTSNRAWSAVMRQFRLIQTRLHSKRGSQCWDLGAPSGGELAGTAGCTDAGPYS